MSGPSNGFSPVDFILPITPANRASVRESSLFGMRVHPIKGTRKLHGGLDLAGPINTPIVAPLGGRVVFAGPNGAAGNMIKVYHGQSASGQHIYTVYMHLNAITTPVGTDVAQGQQIGLLGNTGGSTGPHLHYEVHAVNSATHNQMTQSGDYRASAGFKVDPLGDPELRRLTAGANIGVNHLQIWGPDGFVPDAYIESFERVNRSRGPNGSGDGGDEFDRTAAAVQQYISEVLAQPSALASQIVNTIGSTLSAYIFKGNPVGTVVGSAVLNSVGQNLLQAISQGGINADYVFQMGDGTPQTIRHNILDDFGTEFVQAFQNAAIGSLSSFLAMELGNVLGVRGFGGELITTGASSVFGQVLNNSVALAQGGQAAANIGSNLFHGLDPKGLFGNAVDPSNLANWNVGLLSSAIGSFFGAKLGSLILSPNNTEGAVLSSIGSAVGAWAFGAGASAAGTIGSIGASIATAFGSIGNIVAPFVGSLVGFLLGSLIGRLFGRKKPRIPQASAETFLNITSGYWELGTVTIQNKGNRQLAQSMAEASKDSINGIISGIVSGADIATVSNTIAERLKYGHTGTTIYADEKIGSSWVRIYSGADATAAVENGSLAAIRKTKIIGGDILAKRAIYGLPANSLTQMYGNLLVAQDYRRYLDQRQEVNELIRQAPTSQLALTWGVSLIQAAELRLDEFQLSDFFGGMRGFLNSFGYDEASSVTGDRGAYENISISLEGANLRVGATDGRRAFELLAGSNDIADPTAASQSALIRNFGANVGYTNWSGQATAGNDAWVASGYGYGVTMDDLGYQEEWYWNPYDYTYEVRYTQVSGGDDIFVGSGYADMLYGRVGFDWLDGGLGNDVADGGEQDDVILGGGGQDRLLGGSGNDYISGGDGDDYFFDANRTWGGYGGDGNDTLVGNGGMDSLYGENGDDTFIVDQDGGWTWDVYEGQNGSDTLSYERFTSGVYADFNSLGGWSWNPSAKSIYGDVISNIENLTGSHWDDVLIGDQLNNVIRGLNGDDQLHGGSGDDILDGGLGADYLNGGDGVDTVSYETSPDGVYADMTSGQNGADAIGDVFVSIENVTGSNGADTIKGSGGNNILSGGKGNDLFYFTAGSDVIYGGQDLDAVDFGDVTSAVSMSYSYGYNGYGAGSYATVSGIGTTTLVGVEAFLGSAFADTFNGSGADELFQGRAGNDVLSGGEGSDTYVFGRGDGYDSVTESSSGSNSIMLTNKGLNWRDVSIWGAGGSGALTIYLRPTGEQISVGSNFSYVSNGNHNHKIKTLDLGGISLVDIDTVDWAPGGADSDAGTYVYGGQNKADVIFAYGGNDVIYAAGSYGAYESRGNVIYAGDGDDSIVTSSGDDQFIFEYGNGTDNLTDSGGADTIVMGPSVAADDVIFEVVHKYSDSYGGSVADLYIGLRDPNNLSLTASQVANKIVVQDGGTIYYDLNYGGTRFNSIEHVRVGGQEIDLTKAGINFATSYYYSYDGGGGGGGYIPPLAIDLDGDGIELRSVHGSRVSTVDADGKVWRVGWLGQDDGFLALDRNGDGTIDRLNEISFTQDLKGAKSDLEGLAAYDSNGDDRLDASDARWGEFKIWQDKNQDGIGIKKELMTLAEAGIVSIALKGQATGFTKAEGIDNVVLATTAIGWSDPNRTGLGYDVALAAYQVRTDGAGKDVAEKVKGKNDADATDAKLFGIQAMTAAEIEAAKTKKDKVDQDGIARSADEGMLGRVETFLPGAKKDGEGLLGLEDPKAIHEKNRKDAEDSGKGKKDKFEADAWTAGGSIVMAERDKKMDDVTVPAPELDAKQKADLDEAIRHFAEQDKIKKDKDDAIAARDGAEAAVEPAPRPVPTAAELERMKANDTFRLLDGAKDEEAAGQSSAEHGDPKSFAGKLPGATKAVARYGMPEPAADQIDGGAAAEEPAQDANENAASISSFEANEKEAPALQSASAGAAQALTPEPANDTTYDESGYDVHIGMANARLIQALAGFGGKTPMMVSLASAQDGDDLSRSHWLSVDRQISVQRMASIG